MAETRLFNRQTLSTIYRTFDEFGSGKPGEKLLSEAQFEGLCIEMGLVNTDWSERLFAAVDDDVTGALDIYEFLAGLRKMCDVDDAKMETARSTFAFTMFDLDRGGTLQTVEVKEFIKNFYKVARDVVDRWMGQVSFAQAFWLLWTRLILRLLTRAGGVWLGLCAVREHIWGGRWGWMGINGRTPEHAAAL